MERAIDRKKEIENNRKEGTKVRRTMKRKRDILIQD